ncbi:Eukaryotic translation initiation factor 3 subunit H [Platanthera zijinensis]|uniref:Eukaryotic translation initiation factor 3 subunit H n=1 Tax=Platanthera zijinensis TaxID=2320716 RepID=A0AAP0G1S2_9ASPA
MPAADDILRPADPTTTSTAHPMTNYVSLPASLRNSKSLQFLYPLLSPLSLCRRLSDIRGGGRPWTRKYGTVQRLKARLVARGFTQQQGLDYDEIFSPVAKLNTVRVLISLVIHRHWTLHQLDVKNTFFNDDLTWETFGIFWVSRWFGDLMDFFYLKENTVLTCFMMRDTLDASMPILPCITITSSELMPQTLIYSFRTQKYYNRLVRKLIYLTVTRPDISFAVGVVSRFIHEPRISHLQAVERILRYLKTAPGQGLVYKPSSSPLSLIAYSDADYAGSLDDRRSTSGYYTYFEGHLITWRSKKQSVVARSSAEAEYCSMIAVVSELTWLEGLLSDLGVKLSSLTTVFCHSQVAIHIVKNPVFHEQTKYIKVDCHFIRENVQLKKIDLQHVPAAEQVADILTKENIRRCVCIIYDPSRSNQGVLALKALKLTETFMDLYRHNNFVGEKLREKKLSWVDIFEEIPIKVSNSALISSFMTVLEPDSQVVQCDLDRLKLSTAPFMERNLEFLIECMDDLSSEQNKLQYYYRNLSRQQTQQQTWLQKRRGCRLSWRNKTATVSGLKGRLETEIRNAKVVDFLPLSNRQRFARGWTATGRLVIG